MEVARRTSANTRFQATLRKHAFLLEKGGAPGGTRTLDLLVRSQTLYLNYRHVLYPTHFSCNFRTFGKIEGV